MGFGLFPMDSNLDVDLPEWPECEVSITSAPISTFGKKGQVLQGQAREIIGNVIAFMRTEAENKRPLIPLSNFRERAMKATGISEKMYKTILKESKKVESGAVTSFSTPREHTVRGENEIEWFPCSECSFRTKYKRNLSYHMVQHSSTSEISGDDCLVCTQCSYKTKKKYAFKRHVMLRHTADTETDWKVCGKCSFRTKYNANLKAHMKRHAAGISEGND